MDNNTNFTAQFGTVHNVDTTNADITSTLPDPASSQGGRILFFNFSGNNRIVFTAYDINGLSTFKVLAKGSLELFSDGSKYLITGSYNITIS